MRHSEHRMGRRRLRSRLPIFCHGSPMRGIRTIAPSRAGPGACACVGGRRCRSRLGRVMPRSVVWPARRSARARALDTPPPRAHTTSTPAQVLPWPQRLRVRTTAPRAALGPVEDTVLETRLGPALAAGRAAGSAAGPTGGPAGGPELLPAVGDSLDRRVVRTWRRARAGAHAMDSHEVLGRPFRLGHSAGPAELVRVAHCDACGMPVAYSEASIAMHASRAEPFLCLGWVPWVIAVPVVLLPRSVRAPPPSFSGEQSSLAGPFGPFTDSPHHADSPAAPVSPHGPGLVRAVGSMAGPSETHFTPFGPWSPKPGQCRGFANPPRPWASASIHAARCY
jgi:hypothetical protein